MLVTTAKIADDAVTSDKLNDLTVQTSLSAIKDSSGSNMAMTINSSLFLRHKRHFTLMVTMVAQLLIITYYISFDHQYVEDNTSTKLFTAVIGVYL